MTTIDGATVEKSVPEIHPDLKNAIVEWSDFVGAALMEDGMRVLVLNETSQQLAKNRYGITNVLSLDWNSLMNAMRNNEPKMTGESANG